jgi:shikimate dehydrogenase
MHMAGYAYLGIDGSYDCIETPADGFPDVVALLRNGSLDGVNVTMPHKRNAFAAADVTGDVVGRLEAVNTLVLRDGALSGFNTDIGGVQHALSRLELPAETPVHILGAGGAAAAAIVAVRNARLVSISARSQLRIGQLRKQLRASAAIVPWGSVAEGVIVINATPVGMQGEHLPLGVVESAVGLIDMAYGDAVTPSITTAASLGIPFADGLVMLAGQAAEAFHIFTGEQIPVGVMEAAARA